MMVQREGHEGALKCEEMRILFRAVKLGVIRSVSGEWKRLLLTVIEELTFTRSKTLWSISRGGHMLNKTKTEEEEENLR